MDVEVDRSDAAAQLPIIIISARHLKEIAADAWQALMDSNEPPWLFQHGGQPAVVERINDEQPAFIQHLGFAALRGRIDRVATWVARDKHGELKPATPPRDVVEDMLALEAPLPVLKGLTATPVFAADGTLVSSAGYHAATRLYHEPSSESIPTVPESPTRLDVERAKRLLLDDWMTDFPFVDDSSRAHAVGAALLPIVREFIQGPTPLHVVDAPTEGTGKGYLAKSVGIVVTGREPSVMTVGRSEDEIRKRLTASLRDGLPLIILDNLDRRLESASLAAVLTTAVWKDRLLGKSKMIVVPNRALWLATGNNVALNGEMTRRSVWIRLDAKQDRPFERTGFKHDPLLPWVYENRAQLVWALLVLVRHWIAQGRPAWSGQGLGTFEDWTRVVGGILTTAGIAGFLANRDELHRRVDRESEEWRAFVGCWWDRHADAAVRGGVLYDLACEWELLPSVFELARDDAKERSLRTRFGIALKKRIDRRYGEYFIIDMGHDSAQKGAVYRLEPAADPVAITEPSAPDGGGSVEVPDGKEADLDSGTEPTEPSEPQFNTDHGEQETEHSKGIAIEVPDVPQVPLTDSDRPELAAECRRNLPTGPSEVTYCRGCGRTMSVVAQTKVCGRCKQWGVVPEFAGLVARTRK